MGAVRDTQIQFSRLRENRHWSVEAAVEQRIIKLVRKAELLRTVEEVNESFNDIRLVIDKFPLHDWGLVFDVRDARAAESQEIEDAFLANRKRIYAPFRRQSVLVASAAGVMQVRRMLSRAPDPKIGVFSDEHDAYAWAMGAT